MPYTPGGFPWILSSDDNNVLDVGTGGCMLSTSSSTSSPSKTSAQSTDYFSMTLFSIFGIHGNCSGFLQVEKFTLIMEK